MYISLAVVSCGTPAPAQSENRNDLTIGVPEAIVPGADLGLQNLASTLSVEGLTWLSEDGRALPKLAERWSWEAGGMRLRLLLRPNVKFHDGTPLTASRAAELVRDGLKRPSNRMLRTSINDVVEVRASGERELVFELSRPSAFLPEELDFGLTVGEGDAGTGPYRLLKDDPSEFVLQRFDDYHAGTPWIQQVTIRPFGAQRTAWASLLRGDVDMVTDVPPEALQFVQNDAVRVISYGRRYQYVVAFNLRRPPFNSPIVRRALNAAVNRDQIVTNVLQGRGKVATGPLWPQHWAYDTALPSYTFDPSLSSALLDGVGLRADSTKGRPNTRFRFTCLIPENFSVIERIGLEVQKQLYNIGVDMQFEVVSAEAFNSRIRDGEFEAILIDMISGPSFGRSYLFWASATQFKGLNVFGYENADAERLFGVLRSSTNEAAVRSATSNLQRVFLEDPPALFLAWNERARAIRRDFRVVQDPARDPVDPVGSIWRWTPATAAGDYAQ